MVGGGGGFVLGFRVYRVSCVGFRVDIWAMKSYAHCGRLV